MSMIPPGMIDLSSPEAQFASEFRLWATTYAQQAEKAASYVNVAYARGYLTEGAWPADPPPNGLSAADLGALVDLANEFIGELDDPDKTLLNRLRQDV